MKQKRFARHAGILLSAALAPVAHEAAAQEDSMLEEIVVTARKREENLQRVPMAVMPRRPPKLPHLWPLENPPPVS